MSSEIQSGPTLHMLNKAPATARFESCLEHLAEGDILVLLEDAVLGLNRPELSGLSPEVAVYVLKADAEARGLGKILGQYVDSGSYYPCDMAKVVELAANHPRLINW